MTRITLLTDFGTADGYVAAMKGAIATIAPNVTIDDAGHDVPRGDVTAASHALARYWDRYPPGTVHVVVVDPGVGGARRAIAARVSDRLFVAPDNGVLSRVLESAGADAVVSLDDPAYHAAAVAPTFHGRDIFAPVAAHLAHGVPLGVLGPEVRDPTIIPEPRPRREHGRVVGAVVHSDRFGNLITNIPADHVPAGATVRVAGTKVGPVRRTYADVEPGEVLALIGSTGRLEISVRDGDAGARLEAAPGTEVVVGTD